MKKTILLCLSILLIKNLSGQGFKTDNNLKTASYKKFHISLASGLGIPFGDFGRFNLNLSDSTKIQGAANTGFHYDLRFAYMFSQYIGAELQIGGNLHSADETKIAASANALISTFNTGGFKLPPPVISVDNHYIGEYMAGPVFNFPVNEKFNFHARLVAGIETVSYAPVTAVFGSFFSVVITPKPTSAFAYGGGLGMSYFLTSLISLGLCVDYYYSHPTFENISVSGNYNTIIARKTRMSTGLLNPSLALGFHF